MPERPSLRIPLPSLDGGLVTNLIALASLVTVCLSLAFLTNWRWGMLLAGVLGFAVAVYVQRNMPVEVADAASENVTPIKKSA